MGISIFYSELFKLTGKKRYLNQCLSLVARTIDHLAEYDFPHGYSDGFIGVGCGISWLLENKYLKIGSNFFKDIDDEIFRAGMNDIDNVQYDFLNAGGGAALYALSRLPNKAAVSFIKYFIEALSKIKHDDLDGTKWEDLLSKQVLQSDTPIYNLGLSHGVPSIVMILLKIFQAGLHQETTSKLVKQSLTWILRQRLEPNSTNTSIYPSRLMKHRSPGSSRLSWCYGDLGLATTFWAAAKTLKNGTWQNEAMALINHSLRRSDPLDDATLDAGFCHGTAGIAFFFRKFTTTMQIPECKTRHDFWIDKTLKLGTTPTGIAGYTFSAHSSNELGSENIGLLEGLTGVGLVLIDHLQHSKALDDLLLIGI